MTRRSSGPTEAKAQTSIPVSEAYVRHKPSFKRFIGRFLRSAPDIEDITQEFLPRAYAAILASAPLGWWWFQHSKASQTLVYMTTVGEQKTIFIAAASSLQLNTNIEVQVAYTNRLRHRAAASTGKAGQLPGLLGCALERGRGSDQSLLVGDARPRRFPTCLRRRRRTPQNRRPGRNSRCATYQLRNAARQLDDRNIKFESERHP